MLSLVIGYHCNGVCQLAHILTSSTVYVVNKLLVCIFICLTEYRHGATNSESGKLLVVSFLQMFKQILGKQNRVYRQ